MGESTVRIGVTTNTGPAETGIRSITGLLRGLATEAKGSILAGVGLASGVAAFSLLKNAIGGVTDFLGESVHQAIADEESVSRLGQSLRANVPAWDGNTKAIEKRIAAGELLGFKDEDLRASMALLVGATHDVNKAQELQAAAMDLARFKGIDLQTASDALIKVEGGRYRILASLGIQLGKNATQTQVLAAIQKVAAGQAKEFANTTAGAMEGAQIQFDELKEDIGREFLPILKDLAQFARDQLIPAFRDVIQTIKDAAPVFVAVGKGIDAVLTPVKLALGPIGFLGDRIRALGGDAKAGFEDVAVAGRAGIRALADEVQKGKSAVTDAAEEAIVKPISAAMSDANRKARDAALALPGEIAKALRDKSAQVDAAITQLGTDITEEIDNTTRAAYLHSLLTGDALVGGLNDKRPVVRAQAEATRDAILAELRDIETGAQDIAVNAGVNLATGLQTAMQPVADIAAGLRLRVAKELNFSQDAYAGGWNIGSSWVQALADALNALQYKVTNAMYSYKTYLIGFSPPKAGPLKDIDKGGFNIGKAWTANLAKGILSDVGAVAAALPTLPRISSGGGGLAVAGAGIGAMGGSGALPPIIINLDGRELTASTARWGYYNQGGASRFPAG